MANPQQDKKKRLNRVFELVGKHATEEFAKWQENHDINTQVIDELVTADFDIVDRAYKTGGFKAACRVVVGQTCDRLAQESKLAASDYSDLEDVFKKTADEIKNEEEKRAEDQKQREKEKEARTSPSAPLTLGDKGKIQDALACIIFIEQQKIAQWVQKALDEKQRLLFWKAMANMSKETAVSLIHALASCQGHKAMTLKAESTGLLSG